MKAVCSYLGAMKSTGLVDAIRSSAITLHGANPNFDQLVTAVGSSSFALIGEASHGTHEFYHHRAEITKRLIVEKGFQLVAVEADWPDAYRINKYVRGEGEDTSAEEALSNFKRFPRWMWRNTVVRDFVEWLRGYNDQLEPEKKVGFYGLDLYSMHSSIHAVINYLQQVDPEAAQRAKKRYSCFDHFGKDPQTYGMKVATGSKGCQKEATQQLLEMINSADYFAQEGDDPLWPVQNAAVVNGAENYYRAMFSSRKESWNVRDQHMTDTLALLAKHFSMGEEQYAKCVVWEHNSHLGDARETERQSGGKWNVGQLTRQKFGMENTFNIGFTTYDGTVTAAHEWGDPAELFRVNPGMQGSFEELFHNTGVDQFMLLFRGHDLPEDQEKIAKELKNIELLERAIGVIYRPMTERQSHYLTARIARQFDAIIHIDTTRALVPLDDNRKWISSESPRKRMAISQAL